MPALGDSLSTLFSELLDGPPPRICFVLNAGDRGLLPALDALSAAAASAVPASGGAPIAAHVDHVLYGLSLLNRWIGGEANPWATADWTASWKRSSVTEGEWAALRDRFRAEARRWQETLAQASDLKGIELTGALASVVHLAYHLGAIRQIDRSMRGPSADEVAS
jgi:hypothetical protein